MPRRVIGSSVESYWRRSEAGYKWDEDTRLFPPDQNDFDEYEGPWLVPLVPYGAVVEYSPVDTVGLYRDFAHLEESREWTTGVEPAAVFLESVVAFANRYGLLTQGMSLMIPTGGTWGERTEDWDSEIYYFARQVFLWDLLRDYEASPGALNRRLTWYDADEHADRSWGLSYDRESTLSRFFAFPDQKDFEVPRDPKSGRTLLGNAIGVLGDSFGGIPNDRIDVPIPEVKSHAENLLAYELNRNFRERTTAAQLVQHPLARKTKHVFSLQATTLIGAMYVQLAEEFLGGPQAMQCRCCGTWFHPIRKTRMYCSNRCRQRAARGACQEETKQ